MANVKYWLGPWLRDSERNAWVPPAGTVGLLDFGSNLDCALSPASRDTRGIGLFCTSVDVSLPSEFALLDQGDGREILATDAHRDMAESILGVRPTGGPMLVNCLYELLQNGDPTGQSRWKPLMPEKLPDGSLALTVHLGGHSLIVRDPFVWGQHPHTNRMRDLLRLDLKETDRECKAEERRLRDEAKALRQQGKIAEAESKERSADYMQGHASRVLDGMVRKHGCDPTEISTEIPRGRANTTVTDGFGSTLTGWTIVGTGGCAWSTSSGIVGKTLWQGQAESIRNDTALSSADHYAKCDYIFDNSSRSESWVLARFASGADTHYMGGYEFDNYVSVFKCVAGAQSYLGRNASTGWVSGVTIKCDCSGSTITAYQGAYSKGLTDTAISSNLQCGIKSKGIRTGAANDRFDNFEASDGIAESTGHPTSKRFGGVPYAAVNRGVW